MEFEVIVHNIKKLIKDNDVMILNKFFHYFKNEDLMIEDLYDESIDGYSFVQYCAKHDLNEILSILLQNGFDPNLTSPENDESPLKIAINNNSDKCYKVLIKQKHVDFIFTTDTYETNIYIELAKANEITKIKNLIKDDIAINIIKIPDNIGNNIIFYLDNNALIKQIITLEPKVLSSVNMYNDNFLLHCCKQENKELIQYIISNFKIKIAQLNNEDRNIVHYLLTYQWFNLLDKLEITSCKKELLMFDISGLDPFSLLMNTNNIKYINKYFKFFFNEDCLKHYISLSTSWTDDVIILFFTQLRKKFNDELIFNLIVSLLETKRASLCFEIINRYDFKNKSFYELILYTMEKYNENFKQ